MAGSLTVRQARLVLPDRVVTGDLVVEDGVIAEIGPRVGRAVGLVVDGRGLVVLPGLVDPHVDVGDGAALSAISAAALAGGVTTIVAAGSRGACRELLAVCADLGVHAGV